MASIQKRGKNAFLLVVEAGYDANGKRIRRTKTIKIEDQALLKTTKRLKDYLNAELMKFKTEVESGEYITPEKMNFREFAEREWMKKFAEKDLSPTTFRKYKGQLNAHIIPVFGHKSLNDIKTLHIVSFLDSLQNNDARKDGRSGKLSDATIFDIYKILKSVLSKATEWRVLAKNPMDGVKRPKVERKKMKYYSAEEVEEVIKALYQEKDQWKLYFLGALFGGFRRGELTGLEWSDVDFENYTITIRQSVALTENGQAVVKDPKTEESIRTVDMPVWYMQELKKYYLEWKKEKLLIGDAWEGGDHQYVFHGGSGKPYYFTFPTQQWKRILNRHGLKQIRLHDLRHTAGTLLIEAGLAQGIDTDITLKAVQERLGHKDFKTTADIYTHVTKKHPKHLRNNWTNSIRKI